MFQPLQDKFIDDVEISKKVQTSGFIMKTFGSLALIEQTQSFGVGYAKFASNLNGDASYTLRTDY